MSSRSVTLLGALGFAALTGCAGIGQEGGSAMPAVKPGPAQGYNIHVMAPHKFEDGTVHGPCCFQRSRNTGGTDTIKRSAILWNVSGSAKLPFSPSSTDGK